jgi:hypothetical protein
MTVLPLLVTKAVKQIHHWLREIAYDDMARQASGWTPENARIEKTVSNKQPIKLDFDVPKKHRLAWIQRTIHHLPH